MAYSFESLNYQLPAAQTGDIITGSEEEKKANIIDTQLQGAILAHSGGHGILQEGTYTTTLVSGNGSFVQVSPTSSSPALAGFIQQIFFKENNSISWLGLPANSSTDLLVRVVESATESSRQFGDVSTFSQTAGASIPGDALLVGSVVTSGLSISLDTGPANKVFLRTVADHVAINNNPHGSKLFQNQLVCSGLTVLTSGVIGTLFANQIVTSGITISGTLTVQGAMTVQNALTVNGNTVLSGLTTLVNLTANNLVTQTLYVSGLSEFRNNVTLGSGISIDGIDPSTLTFLIDGNNADYNAAIGKKGHTHSLLSGVAEGYTYCAAGRAIESQLSGITLISFDNTFYRTFHQYTFNTSVGTAQGPCKIVDKIGVTADFIQEDRSNFIHIWNKMDEPSAANILVEAWDTGMNPIALTGNTLSGGPFGSWIESTVLISGTSTYTFEKSKLYTVRYTLRKNPLAASGIGLQNVYLGEATYPYKRGF